MKILFLPNWKVECCDKAPDDKQPPDYYVKGQSYWFFRYFDKQPQVDIIDISSFPWLENFEKNGIRFYIWQALRAIPKLNRYDLVISHGMQSGVVVSLWRRLFGTKSRHIVFDIGAFNSAAESGAALKLMQFASKSIDGIIYHTSSQKSYYQNFFSWIVPKSRFIRFGTDAEFFCAMQKEKSKDAANGESSNARSGQPYCVCIGYNKRDWDTVVKAFQIAGPANLTLRLIGHVSDDYKGIKNIEQIPFIPVKDMITQIRGAEFGILPLKSYNYSYGQMTLLQQMALGKCVIASRVPSLVDYAEDGKTAIFYEPENTADLAEKISLLCSNAELRNQIGQNASGFVMNDCNERIMAKEIEGFLKQR